MESPGEGVSGMMVWGGEMIEGIWRDFGGECGVTFGGKAGSVEKL